MQKIEEDLKQLKDDLGHLKIFCEAIADTHPQGKCLREILHKEINGVEYKKGEPWHEDLLVLHSRILESLLAFGRRLSKIEDEFKK